MNIATTATLKAEKRDGQGKGVARALRREGKIPAIIYSKGSTPLSIALNEREVTVEYKRGRFRSRLIDINISEKESIKVLPKDLQFHPVSDAIEHVDFIRIVAGEKVRVMVPVKFHGQDKCAGLKLGGVLNIVRHEIEFSCSPESIPAQIDIQIQDMKIGDSVHINSVDLPKGVTPVIKRNFTIATIAGRAKEEEKAAEAAPAAAAAPAAGAAAKKEEAKPAAKK